ncbi:DivIVA domain-containing protein [Micromonospora sp. NPDC049679]|uniref:DivIVA domain-containing protein n=1 Tax=Micromonospora sp. NPDC049679 TaxID=3155920 RepID=UPI0033C6B913
MFRYARQLIRDLVRAVAEPGPVAPVVATRIAGQIGGRGYCARRAMRVLPAEVRRKQFSLTKFGRRGLDPAEVDHFLNRVAEEMNALYRDLSTSQEHAGRLRNALREWQSQNARRSAEDHPWRQQPSAYQRSTSMSPPHPNTRFTGA